MLSVFRDGTLHGQAELTTQGLRIGRGSENDIVLEDAAKRVSRLHAELRLEGDGVVTLTDLQSANGTWIAGERVAIEALEPGVPFTIGPYRLMLEEVADTAVAEDSQERPAAQISTAAARDSAAAPPPVPVPAPKRKGDTTKTQGWKAAAGVMGVMDLATRYRRAVLIGGIAVVVLAGIGIYALSRNGASSTVDAAATPTPTPPVETPPTPPPDPHAAHLDEADRLLVQGDKTSAETALRDHILPVLQADPAHARALDLKAVAERIITPVTTATPSTPGSGSTSRAGSKPEDPRAQHAARLAEARSALERGDFKGAVAVLDSLLGDAPDYADAKALQTRVLAERLDAARKLLADAEELVKAGKLVESIEQFRRADATDSSVSVAPRIAEVRARMLQEGEAAFIDGYNFSMAQRPDQAIPLLQKAYRYLPDGHRDKQAARNELERLRVPVR